MEVNNMRGLIYKDVSLFFKYLDKKLIVLLAGAVALVMYAVGEYAGGVTSVMFAATVGLQHIMCFAGDEKADWKKYQLAMPVSSYYVVISKYISVIYTLAVSIIGSLLFNLLAGFLFHSFDPYVLGFSIIAAIIVPLLCTAVCLPLSYWFGFQLARTMGSFVVVIPMLLFLNYFEAKPELSIATASLHSYVLFSFIATLILFGASILISKAGYDRKK